MEFWFFDIDKLFNILKNKVMCQMQQINILDHCLCAHYHNVQRGKVGHLRAMRSYIGRHWLPYSQDIGGKKNCPLQRYNNVWNQQYSLKHSVICHQCSIKFIKTYILYSGNCYLKFFLGGGTAYWLCSINRLYKLNARLT